jgi:hypothetical protein
VGHVRPGPEEHHTSSVDCPLATLRPGTPLGVLGHLDALSNVPRPKGGRSSVTPKRFSIVDTTSGEILGDVDEQE